MKTALQKFINQIDERIEKSKEFMETQDEVGIAMTTMLIAGFMESKFFAQNLLEMEKEQIMNAYKSAEDKSDFFKYEHRYGREYLTAEPYYNETFKQQEQ
jgi:hypothetical protein